MITKPKTRRKKRKNLYFTKVHENAIIAYTKTSCNIERTELYVNWIRPAFNEMVDKIVYTYKFTNLPNIDYLRDECKIWLMTILDKYDPSKGSKAFSYFSVITKNWFIHKVKKQQKRNRREIDLMNISILFESKGEIEIFNKKAIYLYLREITGLNTKQIVNSLKKFRKKYYSFKQGWENGEL